MKQPRRTILLIDDEPHFGRLLKMNIETMTPYACMVTSNGLEGVKAVQQHRPDLVLLDMMMPGISGLETLKRIKAAAPEVPVAMLTAVSREDESAQCFAAGAFDYLAKPVDFGYLKAHVFAKLFGAADPPRT